MSDVASSAACGSIRCESAPRETKLRGAWPTPNKEVVASE